MLSFVVKHIYAQLYLLLQYLNELCCDENGTHLNFTQLFSICASLIYARAVDIATADFSSSKLTRFIRCSFFAFRSTVVNSARREWSWRHCLLKSGG